MGPEGQNVTMECRFGHRYVATSLRILALLGLWLGFWLARPPTVDEASLQASGTRLSVAARGTLPRSPAARDARPLPDMRRLLALARHRRWLAETRQQAALEALHDNLWLHGVGAQLYTAWNAPVTLKAINWYGFEYSPFVPGGLDRVPLDVILSTVHDLGFNALRLTFANETIESNPVVAAGLDANPQFRGMHALDLMERLMRRAHHFGLRVILVNSRSEAGRGPELKSGLWYTDKYPQSSWSSDWVKLITRFKSESALVGADLRNEPHMTGGAFDANAVPSNGPLWGAFRGTYYHDHDWRYAAESLGNQLLAINPHMLIIVEGVQIYLDSFKGVLTGGLWGSNLIGVQYDPVVLSRPGQLVYSVHEYGPHMWQGDWFNPNTTYDSLAQRWGNLWGYLLTARKLLRAPVFVGEFGTCHEYFACISSDQGWKQGFWYKSFVHYLSLHPNVGWAYWALNPDGPFRPDDDNFYSLVTRDWRHYYPMVPHGLAPLLKEPDGLWNGTSSPAGRDLTPQSGCFPDRSCAAQTLVTLNAIPVPSGKGAGASVPITPAAGALFPVKVRTNLPYLDPADPVHVGDLYLPQNNAADLRPAVLVLHGQTWADGTKGKAGTVAMARGLAQHGYIAYDINYRLAGHGGNFPNDTQDVRDAVGFLAANQARFRVDVRRIAVVGAGSGGHLALLTAYRSPRGTFSAPHYGSVRVHVGAVASFFGPVDLATLAQQSPDVGKRGAVERYLGVPYSKNPRVYGQASPISYAGSAVATILFHGRADRTVPIWQPFDLYMLLRQSKIPSQFIDLPGAPHGLGDLSPAGRDTALSQIVSFFDTALYKPPPAS